MIKPIPILILSLFFLNSTFGQKIDTAYGYLNKTGQIVSSKDDAAYILAIIPPDPNVDKSLFTIQEFYMNGKIRLLGTSKNNVTPLMYQGTQIMFFSNGRKMRISNYSDGEPDGNVTEYYPNGKPYDIKGYSKGRTLLYNICKDSTGNVLAENGNGKWIKFFDETFNNYISGEVKHGLEEGEWRGKQDDSITLVWVYKKGQLMSTSNLDKSGKTIKFRESEVVPEYPGGINALTEFLAKNVRYPQKARENNTQGKVIVSFIIETNGSISDIKVERGVGDGCDEEALRVIKLLPRWKPGIQDGKPVRVAFSMPVSFTLSVN